MIGKGVSFTQGARQARVKPKRETGDAIREIDAFLIRPYRRLNIYAAQQVSVFVSWVF